MYCHNSAFLFSDSTFGFEIVTVYSYDAEGLRTEMEENDRLIKFLYDGDKVIAESDTSKGLQRFIRGYGLVSSDCEEARTYYHYASDDLSSITDIIGHDGIVLNHYEYDAFGNFEIKEEQVSNRFGYAGEQYDPATNLYYLRARFFNPVIGRFIQEDTYYGDGLNLYAYCHNNPVGYVDPSGHDAKPCPNKEKALKALEEKGLSPKEAEAEYQRIRDKSKDAAVARAIITGDKTGVSESQILRANMKLQGKKTPPFANAAHHIVAAKAKAADQARRILKKYGIDINDADNGVFLPTKKNKYVGNETMHIGSHSREYHELVGRHLEQGIRNLKKSGVSVTDVHVRRLLDDLRRGLLDGTIKLISDESTEIKVKNI